MKHLTRSIFLFATLLLISAVTINAQHQMNHSQKDTTKNMHHMMNDSTKMHHKMMTDTTKMHHKNMNHEMMDHDTMQTTENKDIWNTHCPIKEGEVDPKAPTVKYKGKTIGFCCPGCDSKFMENPEKYMKKFNEDGTLKK